MIRNQFGVSNQQPRQIYPNQAANAVGGFGAPPVDMSHLTAEERAMIQSVMAKAEMVNNNTPQASTNLHTQMAGQAMGLQQQQQFQQQNLSYQPNMQQMQLMGGPQQQQLRQFDPASGTGNSIRMQFNPSLQNAQQQQQQQQPQQSLAFHSAGSQMNLPIDSSRGQLPTLERRTQDLVQQINSQFNLNRDQSGPGNAGSQPQRSMNPQPAGVMTAVTNQMNAVQLHGEPSAMTINPQQNLMAMQIQPMQNQIQNFPQQQQQQQQQQMFNAGQQVAQGGLTQLTPMFNVQNQPMNPQSMTSAQNFQQMNQSIPATMLPNQTSLDCQFVAPFELQNQMLARQQQQLVHNPQAYGLFNNVPNLPSDGAQLFVDERQNIKFKHDGHVLSDQENRNRRDRMIRRNRPARWNQFSSVELADGQHDENHERASRWRHELAAPVRRLPKRISGQSRGNQTVLPDSERACSSERAGRRRQAARQASNLAPSSSESSLSGESISGASSDEAEQTRSRRHLPKPDKHEGRAESPGASAKAEMSSSKASKLMSELKLNEQASQMMEQQQLLIKQSQELIKLQQAQLEQQAKRPPDESLSTSALVSAKSDELPQLTGRQAKTKYTDSSEIRDAHETDSSIDSDHADRRQQAHVREQRSNQTIKRAGKPTRKECGSLAESPTNTTGSDSELLSRHPRGHSRQKSRCATPTRKPTASREYARASAGFTPSPLPVEAAVELHHLQQALHSSEAARGRSTGGCSQQRAPRSRIELLRSRSVCNSPQSLLIGRIVGANSPDCNLGELAQRLAQRKLLPDPPANAVPLTPSMVRKMVETQRVAAGSSGKLPTSINAQSTLLTNNHSFRQPFLDQRPSSVVAASSPVGYQCDQLNRGLRLAPRPVGSYTAHINGAQVSFAHDQSSTAGARHQRLSALSRADLSKFLDFTYSSSILKSSPQRHLQRTTEPTMTRRPNDELYRPSPGRALGERPIYEPLSFSERRLQAYRDERLSSRSMADRRRRNSEGDGSLGYPSYRSRSSAVSKHVNFKNNNLDQAAKTSDFYPPSLSSSMPNRSRPSQLSELRIASSPQRNEWSSLENRLSRYRTHSSSIDNARFSSAGSEWLPRLNWASNAMTTSDRILNRYNTSRVAYSDYEPTRYTSSSSLRNPSFRCPYKQRSFDNS